MTPEFTGRIVEWDRDKGCGRVDAKGQRIFLHIREFALRHKVPEVGDVVRFRAGTDQQGRLCASEVEHVSDGRRFGIFALLLLCALLVLPGIAVVRLMRLTIGFRFVAGYAVSIAGVTYLLYATDKKRARTRQWRISEAVLHFFELIGGWPGAFIAQRGLRHKCSKLSYQTVFWLIVLAYQAVALDFLLDWKIAARFLGR